MTTLYRPVLIESSEQAEALPRKALVFDNETDGWIQPLIKAGRGDGDWFWMGDDEWEPHPEDLIGWTALVPIEAAEEWAITHPDEPPAWSTAAREDALAAAERGIPTYIRHRTPWEKA